jgi:hypothetical protein
MTLFNLPVMRLAVLLEVPLLTAVPVLDADPDADVEDTTLGGEVIVAPVANFERLALPVLAGFSDVVVATASLKALRDAIPAVIWTGINGGRPHRLFS